MLFIQNNYALFTELGHIISHQMNPDAIQEKHWEEIIRLSLDHGLGGMLLWSLREMDWKFGDQVNWQPLVDIARKTGRHNLLLEKARWQCSTLFDRNQIPAIWLKGISLAQTHYPKSHLRPMVDLDVLIPHSQLAAARDTLIKSGYQQAEEDFYELGGLTELARHHEGLLDKSGNVKLDLHFRLLIPTMVNSLNNGSINWFWTQTTELSKDGPSFLTLKPEANLLYLCAHAFLQDEGEFLDLLHLFDLHLLLTKSTIDWNLVVKQAEIFNWTDAIHKALIILPDIFGTFLPSEFLDDIQKDCFQIRLPTANIDHYRNTRRWDNWFSIFRHMNIPNRLRLILVTIFPPGIYLRKQYHIPAKRFLAPYYLTRLRDGGREAIRALIGTCMKIGIHHDKG